MDIRVITRYRLFSTVAKVVKATAATTNHVKSFESIPGPPRLPFVGSLYLYNGKKKSEYHKVLKGLREKYGPVVKEYRGNHAVVHLFDPNDSKIVYDSEGKSPVIPPLQETTQLYRKQRELSLGLGNTNGEEWYRLRHAVQKMMLRPKEVSYYLPYVDNVARAFTEKLESTLDAQRLSPDLRQLVAKWSLESAGIVCFERRLGAFSENEELAEKMIQANKDIFVLAGQLKLSIPLYKYWETPKWKRFLTAEDFFYSQAQKLIQETIDKISDLTRRDELRENQFNFMTYLLSRKELSQKDVFIITLSLFGDGLSTTTPSFMFNLYCLAKHPEVQERIFDEICKTVPTDATITVEMMNQLQLLKASVKETFRLYPNGTEISRIIQTDLVLGGYSVPAGTHVDLNQLVNFRSPKYFNDPEKYAPERWLRDDNSDGLSKHPFLLIPFGFGTRMCAGRRFAEQDMYTGLTRILQKYKLELRDPNEEMEQVYETLLFPKRELRIKFIKR